MFRCFIIFICVMFNLYGDDMKSVEQDCKVLCEKCGFYARQTEDYFKKLKNSNENKDDFYIAMDDWTHYLGFVEDYLSVNEIETKFYAVPVEKCEILSFKDYFLEVGTINSPYIFMLYQKGKTPYKLMDISAPEDEINAYFNISSPKYPKQGE